MSRYAYFEQPLYCGKQYPSPFRNRKGVPDKITVHFVTLWRKQRPNLERCELMSLLLLCERLTKETNRRQLPFLLNVGERL